MQKPKENIRNDFFQTSGGYTNKGLTSGIYSPTTPWALTRIGDPLPETTPYQLQRIIWDAETIIRAITNMESYYYPSRTLFIQICETIAQNAYVTNLFNLRYSKTINKGVIVENENGIKNDAATNNICNNQFFKKICRYILDAVTFGYSGIYLGEFDSYNNKYPYLMSERRELIQPDRRGILQGPDYPQAVSFDSELIKDLWVLITTENDTSRMPCGYGLMYKIMLEYLYFKDTRMNMAEFLARFGVPGVIVKSDFANDQVAQGQQVNPEIKSLQNALESWGQRLSMIVSPETNIEIAEAKVAKSDAFGQPLEFHKKDIAGLILGHQESVTSTPGKLGSEQGGEESPQQLSQQQVVDSDCNFLVDNLNSNFLDRFFKLNLGLKAGDKFKIENTEQVKKQERAKVATNTQYFMMLQSAKQVGYEVPIDIVKKDTGLELDEVKFDINKLQEDEEKQAENKLINNYFSNES